MMLRRKHQRDSDDFKLVRVTLSKGCIELHIKGTTYDKILLHVPETQRIKNVVFTNRSENGFGGE